MSGEGERTARLEEVVNGLKHSVDLMREEFKEHAREEKSLSVKVDKIESELDKIQGGYRVFLKMCFLLGTVASVAWGIGTWVARNHTEG